MASIGEIFKGKWTIWGMSLGFALLSGFGVLVIVGHAADQSTYYVMKADVAAHTQVTMGMLTPVSTSATGVPPTALSLNQFAKGNLYTKIPLKAGDVVSSSVVGQFQSLTSILPSGFMIASLKVAPENAVGGRIKSGDYIDIAAINSTGHAVAKIVLHHVLVLDVTVLPASITSNANTTGVNQSGTGPDSPAIYNGIPQMYTLAVIPQDFLALALIKDSNIYLGLSGNGSTGSLTAYLDPTALFAAGSVPDSGAGTENVFGSTATPTKP